jgi:tetratricopeptide (TPR) repeat protein
VTETAEDLNRMARSLQFGVGVTRLLKHLFPGGDTVLARPGRHRVLEDVIETSPGLFHALLADDREAVLRAWAGCLQKRGADLRLDHTLAVLYRERALEEIARDNSSDSVLVFATTLWSLLLSTKAFWQRQSGRTPAEEASLRDTVVRELLTLHVTIGSRKLAEGAVEAARPHLSCLADCRTGDVALKRTLKELGLPYHTTVDQHLGAEISAIAENLLSGWCADILRVARKTVDDPAAIAGLPEGIRLNYRGGISRLEPFVRTGVPVAQILRTGLEWYNEWCFSLYDRQEVGEIRKLLTLASEFADKLIPLCGKGSGYKPENQALSRYFMFRGFAFEELEAALTAYRTSLEWNPANANAQSLLHTRESELVEARLDTVLDLIEAKAFEEARRILDTLPDQGSHGLAVEYIRSAIRHRSNVRTGKSRTAAAPPVQLDALAREVLVPAYLRHAVRAAGNKQFGPAVTSLRTALELDPSPVNRTFAEQQLAAVLNAQGVELINESQQIERTLNSAIGTVTSAAETRLHALARVQNTGLGDLYEQLRSGSTYQGTPRSCACCTKTAVELGMGGFDQVVDAVCRRARSAGSFRVTNPVRFWTQYEQHLCQSCRQTVDSVAKKRKTASGLLREAARLDPRNKTIRKNVQVLEELGRRT